MAEQKNGMTEEQWVRFGVGMGHMIGGIVASAFGAGAAVQPMGQLEDQIITAAYDSKKEAVSPGPVVNGQARMVMTNNGQTPPVSQKIDPAVAAMYGIKQQGA